MKNIHILPTWQPSRLVIDTIENKLSIQDILHEKTINILPQNLFITSDEEIKEGDFFYSVRGVIEKAIINYPKGEHFGKLILTTDQNLIKYGVQAIDDVFLEWFVKNPSCEEVETVFNNRGISGAEKILKTFGEYEIKEPKQETLEEVAEKWFNKDGFYPNPKQGFISGAKWMQERSYSEEEVLELWNWLNDGFIIRKSLPTREELIGWFETFKNK